MTALLERQTVSAQLECYATSQISAAALAGWAFKQFADEEEGLLVYESGYEEHIGAVLDDLMWADADAFSLDAEAARRLQQRLFEDDDGHDAL